MLAFLRRCGRLSDRKARLFSAGCYRTNWARMGEGEKRAVATAERYADGLVGRKALATANKAANDACCAAYRDAGRAACYAARAVGGSELNWPVLCGLLRDLFGPLPFRPVAIDPSWLTPPVVALAATIYDDRAWGDLPILGDALQEAGCSDAEVLAHCHGPAFHARGCWVVDLLLNKE